MTEQSEPLTRPEWEYYCPTANGFEEKPLTSSDGTSKTGSKRKKPSRCILVILVGFLLALVGLTGGIIGRLTRFPLFHSSNYIPINVNDAAFESWNGSYGFLVPRTGPHDHTSTSEAPTIKNYREDEVSHREAGSVIVNLPEIAMPSHYDLYFEIMGNIDFSAQTEIVFRMTTVSRKIVLNAKELTIFDIQLKNLDTGATIRKASGSNSYAINRTSEMLAIYFHDYLLPRWTYQLAVNYSASMCFNVAINCDSSLPAGPIMFATKLEPMAARALFPCFDEPRYKATFNVTILLDQRELVRASNVTALSNEALCRKEELDGQTLYSFCQTPIMSTYTLAIVIGEFSSQCSLTAANNIPLCIYVPPYYERVIPQVLHYALKYLNMLQDYFIVDYPLSKLDLVGIKRYSTAAMENWGLIVHNMASLRADPHMPFTTHLVQRIILHELLHQWFGNMVTMRWWDDVWLNEGFAQFYAYYFLEKEDPVTVETSYQSQLINFFNIQAKEGHRHTLVRNFTSSETLRTAFHGSGYFHLYIKGAAVVKMLMEQMSPQLLRKGIVQYLMTHRFSTAQSKHLWRHLEGVSGAGPITEIMNCWIKNPGYPEIHLTRNYLRRTITAEQHQANEERHMSYYPFQSDKANYPLWTIPLNYIKNPTAEATTMDLVEYDNSKQFWFYNRTQVFTDPTLESSQWILANPDAKYPFIVNYDLRNWKLLQRQLLQNHTIISHISRAHLLSSAAFFLKNSKDLTVYLSLLRYLEAETEPLPWLVAQHDLQKLFLQFRSTSAGYLLSLYVEPAIRQLSTLLSGQKDRRKDSHSLVFNHRSSKWCRLLCATRQPICENWAKKKMVISTNRSISYMRNQCAPVFMCHRMRHRLSSEERDAIRLILDDDVPLSAIGHILKPLLCICDYEIKQRLFNASVQQNRLLSVMQGLLDPLTLEHDPLYHDLIYDIVANLGSKETNSVKRWLEARHRSTGLQFNEIRWAALRPADFKKIAKILPSSWERDLKKHEQELLWIHQMAPQLTDWLMKHTAKLQSSSEDK